MRFFLLSLLILIGTSCADNKPKTTSTESKNPSTVPELKTEIQPFKIDFDEKLVSSYKIENEERGNTKAMVKRLSEYTTKELEELPNSKRLTLSITVPFDISKKSLKNTLKSIASDQTNKNNDIDEIVIFAYDDKDDIGRDQYTFGKLLWAPNGKTGNVTPLIAKNNTRNNYEFDIIIKDKVGEIKKADLPTARELKIYNEIMSEKYWDMQEEQSEPIIMKKFKITKKELNAIWLKVAAYKM
jgi:hypothetical protein